MHKAAIRSAVPLSPNSTLQATFDPLRILASARLQIASNAPERGGVMVFTMSTNTFMQQLEKHDNEVEVRERIARGQYHGEHLGIAQEWLRRKEESRSAQSEVERKSREERMAATAEEALSIAKEANRIASEQAASASASSASAREQARWAKWAAIIATAALIITNIEAIVSSVSKFIR